MIAVNWSMPNMPRLDTENVEPVYSSGLSLRSRARLRELARLAADLPEPLAVARRR